MDDDSPPLEKLNYATPSPQRNHFRLGFAIAFAILGALALTLKLLSTDGHRPVANRVMCASNLRQIGQAILLYSQDNHGEYPNDLAELVQTEEITSDAFICPDSNNTPAKGPTTQAIATNMRAGGHLSYIYLGKGMNTKTVSADTVIAYEPLNNHSGYGSNALFGDGHVEFVVASAIKTMEAKRKSTTAPVTMPTSP